MVVTEEKEQLKKELNTAKIDDLNIKEKLPDVKPTNSSFGLLYSFNLSDLPSTSEIKYLNPTTTSSCQTDIRGLI